MRWTLVIFFFIGAVYTSEDESNEVIIAPSSVKPPKNLDSNLRKALLKALVELESEEKENLTRNDYVNIITRLDSDETNVQKASASSLSFFSQAEPINMTVTVKKTTSKPTRTVVIQKSKRNQANENFNVLETPEQIIASASNSFASTKSEKSRSGGAQQNSLTVEGKSKKSKYVQTTTIKPTSSTEESEAIVENLQFFQAPLVAAFTVHQDEKGLPNSVVPIYNQGNAVTTSTEKQQVTSVRNPEVLQREVLKQQRELEARQEIELRTKQLQLEDEIKRLKKLREEQETIIREQKLIYEQKLLEHQKKLFEEQQRLLKFQSFIPQTTTTTTVKPSFQNNINNNFRERSRNTGTSFSIQSSVGFVQPDASTLPQNAQVLPIKNPVDFKTPYPRTFSQFDIQNSIGTESRPIGTSHPFLPSQSSLIPLQTIQNSITPSISTAQNLIIPSVNLVQNPYQGLPTTQLLPIFQQPQIFNQNGFSTNQNQNLPFVTPQTAFRNSIPSPSHGTRSLRQESGTGNFVNNRYNVQDSSNNFFRDHRFNTNSFSSQQVLQSPRTNLGFNNPNGLSQYQYNTLQYSVDQPFLNQRFNNLLQQTGLGQGKQQENLNIVSKVLSLNHLAGDSQLANSNNDFKRIRASPTWRVV